MLNRNLLVEYKRKNGYEIKGGKIRSKDEFLFISDSEENALILNKFRIQNASENIRAIYPNKVGVENCREIFGARKMLRTS